MLKYFASYFWIHTPSEFQKFFSNLFSLFFKNKLSKFFILPYCIFFSLDGDYLNQFESENEENDYRSFSSFFERKYKKFPKIESGKIWPCEGYFCDWGTFSEKNDSVIKGQTLNLNTIFNSKTETTRSYFFTNIFLHNHNYHRIHSPITGTITKISSINGALNFLRPWFYKKSEISFPAFKNERVIFEIEDENNKKLYLAMIGGFGVGTIEIHRDIFVGKKVVVGKELAMFKLGSTVCLATPFHIDQISYLKTVKAGSSILETKQEYKSPPLSDTV